MVEASALTNITSGPFQRPLFRGRIIIEDNTDTVNTNKMHSMYCSLVIKDLMRVLSIAFALRLPWVCKQDIGDGAWGHTYKSPEHGPIHHVKFFYDKSHLSLPQS